MLDAAVMFIWCLQEAVNRVRGLEEMGYITGVIDDRGKFIYITTAELESVARFVEKRGRVRISTLAQESNKLIDLTPRKAAENEGDESETTDAARGGEVSGAA